MTPPTTPATNAANNLQKEAGNDLVISFLALRNLIGISGMLLPVILTLLTPRAQQDKVMEHSISEYYYTSNGDILVVLLSVIGVFLLTYKGYNELWERVLTILAAVGAIGVAFFPTATEIGNSLSIHKVKAEVPEVFGLEWHYVFAGVFFLALAIISLHYFPKTYDKSCLQTASGKQTAKAKRNVVFRLCGWIMIACLGLMILYLAIKPESLKDKPVIFILETIAVEAFGVSWITKGETLWPDGEHYMKRGFAKMKDTLASA
jgi:hypothetical protein